MSVFYPSEAFLQISHSMTAFLVLLTHTFTVHRVTPSSTLSTAEQGGSCLATLLLEKA